MHYYTWCTQCWRLKLWFQCIEQAFNQWVDPQPQLITFLLSHVLFAFLVYICVYVCVCVFICVTVLECAVHLCAQACGSWKAPYPSFLRHTPPCVLGQSLSQAWNSPIRLGLLSKEHQESSHPCLPSTSIAGVWHQTQLSFSCPSFLDLGKRNGETHQKLEAPLQWLQRVAWRVTSFQKEPKYAASQPRPRCCCRGRVCCCDTFFTLGAGRANKSPYVSDKRHHMLPVI